MTRPLLALVAALALVHAAAAAPGPDLGLPTLTDAQVERYRAALTDAGKAIRAGEHDRAARHQAKALAIWDGNGGLWYDHACALALAGRTEEAMTALHRASERGWTDPEWPVQDGDLATLHGTPAFEAWIASLEAPRTAPLPDDVGPLTGDAQELRAAMDEADARLEALAPVIGLREARARTTLAAWASRSWLRVAETATDDVARTSALAEALRAAAGKDLLVRDPALAADARRAAEALLAARPDGGHAVSARLALIQADAASHDGDAEGSSERRTRALLVLAATAAPGEALHRVLVELVDALAETEPDHAAALLARLRREAGEDAARTLVLSSARGDWYRLTGLPPFTARTLDGVELTAASLPGRVTLLDFWATWCGPCRAELPHLKNARERFGPQGFEIVGVSLDRAAGGDPKAFLAWCADNGVTWPQVFDGGHWESELPRQFGVKMIPFPLLVDDAGRVLAADEELRGEALFESIEKALARSATAVGQ